MRMLWFTSAHPHWRVFLAAALLSSPSVLADTPGTSAKILVSAHHRHTPSVDALLRTSRALAQKRIPYVFGGTSVKGMDCSGSVQHLFRNSGVPLPRTSEAQANHLAQTARLWRVAPWETEKMIGARLRPGDLLFWPKQGNPSAIGHVMMFVGLERDGRFRLWGARGRGKTGISGSGVDFFTYRPGARSRKLLAYGRPPLP